MQVVPMKTCVGFLRDYLQNLGAERMEGPAAVLTSTPTEHFQFRRAAHARVTNTTTWADL